jgi:hypothetical protein
MTIIGKKIVAKRQIMKYHIDINRCFVILPGPEQGEKCAEQGETCAEQGGNPTAFRVIANSLRF